MIVPSFSLIHCLLSLWDHIVKYYIAWQSASIQAGDSAAFLHLFASRAQKYIDDLEFNDILEDLGAQQATWTLNFLFIFYYTYYGIIIAISFLDPTLDFQSSLRNLYLTLLVAYVIHYMDIS